MNAKLCVGYASRASPQHIKSNRLGGALLHNRPHREANCAPEDHCESRERRGDRKASAREAKLAVVAFTISTDSLSRKTSSLPGLHKISKHRCLKSFCFSVRFSSYRCCTRSPARGEDKQWLYSVDMCYLSYQYTIHMRELPFFKVPNNRSSGPRPVII